MGVELSHAPESMGLPEALGALIGTIVAHFGVEEDFDNVEVTTVSQTGLMGGVPAVTTMGMDGSIVMLVNDDLTPIQQLRALLAEVDAHLAVHRDARLAAQIGEMVAAQRQAQVAHIEGQLDRLEQNNAEAKRARL